MNEYEIAINKVLPSVRENMKWPDDLISPYGRVPVQIGTSTVWADFVFYISQNQKAVPWLLIEVKQPGNPINQAVPQAESYSLIIGAPFFCVTDGDEYEFYMTGSSQGKNIKLQHIPPIPSSEDYLQTGINNITFPPMLDNLIDLFFVGLKQEEKFFNDTVKHCEAPRQLHEKVFSNINSLSPQDVKDAIEQYFMIKPPNKNQIFAQIDEDFGRFKSVLEFMRDFKGDDPVININRLMDKDYYFKGAGIFFLTQLLAGAHPDEYVILEENVSMALHSLGITDILVKNDTANGYIYINEICKKLYKDKLEAKLKEFGFGLAAVHNFLWHYYVNFQMKKKWYP